MPLQIIRRDITTVCADAIVNTTNEAMQGFGGVDYEIHTAAGAELDAECAKLAPLEQGFAKITKGYGLHCKYIIHTFGPVYRDGRHGERALLKSCYSESLRLAKEHQCESVAFPLISAGTYGYPKDDVLRCAVQAISEFLHDNEMEVYLCVFDRESYALSRPLMDNLCTYILSDKENQIQQPKRAPRKRELKSFDDISYAESRCMEAIEPCMSLPKKQAGDEALRAYLKQMDKSFAQTLFDYIEAQGITDVACYKKANIDRRTFSKIRSNPDYKPSKQTAVAFAIALRLDLGRTQHLLATAGLTLSDSQLFDKIIRYFILNKIYDVFEINEALFAFDQVLLGC